MRRMMMRNLLATQVPKLLLLMLPFALQACAGGAASGTRQQTQTNDNLHSISVVNRETEMSNIEELLAIIRNERLREEDPQRVARAINRLGVLRSDEAISDLSQLLSFRLNSDSDSTGVYRRFRVEDNYPARSALFLIGEPSLPALIRVIEEHESNSLASENAIYTIMAIYRENPRAGIEYLREKATRASSPEAAQRLSEAAQKAEGRAQQ